jgi:CheY-like chemotaxis protein
MPTESTLTLVDAIAEDAKKIGLAASDDGLRAQAALVRALVDELGHHHPSELRTAALHAQLGEELSRLAELVPDGVTRERQLDSARPFDVLVVEDDQANLNAMASTVRDLGYTCRTANSAEDGLKEYEQQRAAIVISDWHMTGLSGLDLCRALKHRDAYAYVILVTAFYDHALLREGARMGIDDLLPKPIDVDELASRLGAAERLVRAVRVLERVRDRLHARTTSTQVGIGTV